MLQVTNCFESDKIPRAIGVDILRVVCKKEFLIVFIIQKVLQGKTMQLCSRVCACGKPLPRFFVRKIIRPQCLLVCVSSDCTREIRCKPFRNELSSEMLLLFFGREC